MCSHCHHLAPTWKEIAKLLDGVVKIAAVNCEYNWQLCHQIGIRAYPTLLYFQKVCKKREREREREGERAQFFFKEKLNLRLCTIFRKLYISS